MRRGETLQAMVSGLCETDSARGLRLGLGDHGVADDQGRAEGDALTDSW